MLRESVERAHFSFDTAVLSVKYFYAVGFVESIVPGNVSLRTHIDQRVQGADSERDQRPIFLGNKFNHTNAVATVGILPVPYSHLNTR